MEEEKKEEKTLLQRSEEKRGVDSKRKTEITGRSKRQKLGLEDNAT